MTRPLALVMTDDAHSIRVLEQALAQYHLRVVVIESRDEIAGHIPALAVLNLQSPDSFEALMHPNLRTARTIILTSDIVCAHLTGRAVDAELLQPISVQDVTEALRQMPEFAPMRDKPAEGRAACSPPGDYPEPPLA